MSKIIVILLGFFVLNTVGAEQESPAAISESTDVDHRTGIHEDLRPNENSRTINIKIINPEPLDQAIGKTAIENDGNLKLSTETELPITDDVERIGLTDDFVDDISESKVGDSIERSETEVNDENDSINDFEVAIGRVAKSSDDNVAPSVPEEISRNDRPHEAALESVESEGKSMIQDVMLDTKGRGGESPESLEEVKAVSAEDVRTFKSPKPMDSAILRRRLSEIIVPNYFKALSRSAFPYNPTVRNFQNSRPPYFGRLTNSVPSSQSRRYENSATENTRRTGSYSTESDQDLKLLEEYTDANSNAYPYVQMTTITPFQRIMPSRNDGLQQKLLDAASQQYLAQINPYSNEFSPVQYAANYPYRVNALARFQ